MLELSEKRMTRLGKKGKLVEREVGRNLDETFLRALDEPENNLTLLQIAREHIGREIRSPSALPVGVQYISPRRGEIMYHSGLQVPSKVGTRKSPRSVIIMKSLLDDSIIDQAFPRRTALVEQETFLHEVAHAIESTRKPAERIKRARLASKRAREQLFDLLESNNPKIREQATRIAKEIVLLSKIFDNNLAREVDLNRISEMARKAKYEFEREAALKWLKRQVTKATSRNVEESIFYQVRPHATSFQRTALQLQEEHAIPIHLITKSSYQEYLENPGRPYIDYLSYGILPKRTLLLEKLAKMRWYRKQRPKLP